MAGTDELPLIQGTRRRVEMGRGLPQEVIEKAKKEVSVDDRFYSENNGP
jgi:hypothetical protein